ncbi:hypothetical protein K503DRAFT_464047 [Rhizopogon vinicolor AM-OR11-026]|uniref:Uncharacterized protein n=1 Tax=Rhizopogon vinicolor AM-OR11-026 TaxID=1314800 RepID=A0A1B7MNP1_9AGAM|nr:hypothetical protein K503DRAFT_464047 [Rhizopogon vinicolor AM-OR11-026]
MGYKGSSMHPTLLMIRSLLARIGCFIVFTSLFSLPRTGIRSERVSPTRHPPCFRDIPAQISTVFLTTSLESCSSEMATIIQAQNMSSYYGSEETPPESVSTLVSLLKMSTVFDVSVGKSYAINRLEVHPDLDLPTKLQLCHQFKIRPWLTPALKLVSLRIEILAFYHETRYECRARIRTLRQR